MAQQPRNNRRRRGGGGGGKPKPLALWRPVPPLPDPEPIVPVGDPAVTAVLRSLGDPPLQGQGTVAHFYMAEVVRRAGGLAEALAETAGLRAAEPDDG
jgi:hypothetical protein